MKTINCSFEIQNKLNDLNYTFTQIIIQIKNKAPHLSLREKVDEYTGIDWYGVVEHTCRQIDRSLRETSSVGKLNMHADCPDGLIYDTSILYNHIPFLTLLQKAQNKLSTRSFESLDQVSDFCEAFKRAAMRLRN